MRDFRGEKEKISADLRSESSRTRRSPLFHTFTKCRIWILSDTTLWWFFSMADYEEPLSPLAQCDYSEWSVTRVLIPGIYVLAFVIGTLGNGLVLWVLLDRRSRGRGSLGSCSKYEQTSQPSPSPWRSTSNTTTTFSVTESLIASLALADLAFVMTLPLWAAYTGLDYHWPFSSVLCQVSSYMVALNMYASVFSLTGLSVERYCVIARRAANNTMRNRAAASRAWWIVGSIWATSCILALPALLLRTVREVEVDVGSDEDMEESGTSATMCLCDMDYSSLVSADLDPEARERAEVVWSAALGLKSTLLGFLLPLVVLLLCYCSLGRLLCRHFGLGPRPDRPRQRRLLRVIVTLVLAFFICWLPFHTNKTLSALVELDLLPFSCSFDRWLVAVHPYAICLAYVNSCLNPLLYACCDPSFRRRCKVMVRCLQRRGMRKGVNKDGELPSKCYAMPSGTKEDTENGGLSEGMVTCDTERTEVRHSNTAPTVEYFKRL